jgi:hypothetical protein
MDARGAIVVRIVLARRREVVVQPQADRTARFVELRQKQVDRAVHECRIDLNFERAVGAQDKRKCGASRTPRIGGDSR